MQGLVVLPQGATLFETLMLNLIEYDAEKSIAAGDAPAWEQAGPLAKQPPRAPRAATSTT